MKKNNFEYLRPLTIAEACDMKEKYAEKAKYWAGGTDLLLQWQQGVVNLDYCIDLTFIPELSYIRQDSENLSIGALTILSSIETSSEIDSSLSIISEGASELATPQIRNTATIGGNVCRAAPSADMAPPLLVLGTEVKLVNSSGERWLALDEFFLGLNKTAREENELLVEIRIPVPSSNAASCFLKVGRTVVDIAIVNMAASMTMDDNAILSDVRIAFGAVAPTPLRIKLAEEMLLGVNVSAIDSAMIDKVSDKVANEVKPITDVRGTMEYRREISRVLTKRAIERNTQALTKRVLS